MSLVSAAISGFPGTWESLNFVPSFPCTRSMVFWVARATPLSCDVNSARLASVGCNATSCTSSVFSSSVTQKVIAYSARYFGGGAYSRSDDGGATWNDIALPQGFDGNVWQDFRSHPTAGRAVLTDQHNIIEWDEDTARWYWLTPVKPGMGNTSPSGIVTHLACAGDPKFVYAAYDSGRVFKITKVKQNWTKVQWDEVSGGTTWANQITGMAVDPLDSDVVDAVTDRGRVWRRGAGGPWEDITGNLPPIPAHAVAVAHSKGADPYLVVATDVGAYGSSGQGEAFSWEDLGLPNVRVTDVEYNAATSIFAAATYGRGVFILSFVTPLLPLKQFLLCAKMRWLCHGEFRSEIVDPALLAQSDPGGPDDAGGLYDLGYPR